MHRRDRQILYLLLALTVGVPLGILVGASVLVFGAETFVAALYEGRLFTFLTPYLEAHRLEDPAVRNLAFYMLKIPELFVRYAQKSIEYLAMIDCAGLVYLYRTAITKRVKRFFSETDSPFNLATFRIIFFGFIIFSLNSQQDMFLLAFKNYTPASIIAPVGTESIIAWLPMTVSATQWAFNSLMVTCLFALLGFYTRLSILLSVVLGYYVFMLPNLFGKVDHAFHHLWWFMLILGFSRCGDVLSVDAVLRAWRSGRASLPPRRSRAYAFPLRMIWILIGVTYFFPGWKKFYHGGFDWFLSDNLKYWMHDKWYELGGWLPAFRVDHYPVLYKFGAFGTIVWEAGFIFLVLFPAVRWIAPVMGLLFHELTRQIMRISFTSLVFCYVSFVNWRKFALRLRHMIGPKPVRIYPSSIRQERWWSVLMVLDIFGCLRWAAQYSQSTVRVFRPQRRVEGGLILAAILLMGANCYFGAAGIGQGWPFAGYPTFSHLAGPEKSTIELRWASIGGRVQALDLDKISHLYSRTRLGEIIRFALFQENPQDRDEVLGKVSKVLLEKELLPKQAAALQFYQVTVTTDPDKQDQNPLQSQLLVEFPVVN